MAVVRVALDRDSGDLEDLGAVTAIAVVGTAVGATALGHRQALAGGLMLLAIGLAPIVVGVQTVYMMPAVIYGTLYVLSDRLARRGPAPSVERPGSKPLRDAA